MRLHTRMIQCAVSAAALWSALLAVATTAMPEPLRFPNRPITIVVPLQAGTASDLVARIIAERFSTKTGKQMMIENVVGGGGGTGALRVARADPDGYTLGAFNNGIHTILPFMGNRPAFDPMKDFLPITQLARFPSVLIVDPELPVNNLKELIDLAKRSPGKLTYASVGVGSPQHLAMEQLKQNAGIDLLHVPYRGGAQATQAIASKEVNAFWIATSVALPFIESKAVKVLAVGDKSRTRTLPNVPTVDEAAIPGYEYIASLALFAPKGTPGEVIAYLHREITDALKDPTVIERLKRAGLEPQSSTPQELQDWLNKEAARMRPLIVRLGLDKL